MSIFNKKPDAAAYIKGGISAPSLFGRVTFYQNKDSVLIVAKIFNLPESASGFYGFHIHQGKACTGDSFSNTAGH